MARKTGLFTGEVSILRSAATALAADSATLTDANFPVANAVNCKGFDTILVGAEITAGSSPTMTVEVLVRDAEAPNGSRWKRLYTGLTFEGTPAIGDTGALGSNSDFVELSVFGHALVYFRIKAVANEASTTAWKILGMPGRVRSTYGQNR